MTMAAVDMHVAAHATLEPVARVARVGETRQRLDGSGREGRAEHAEIGQHAQLVVDDPAEVELAVQDPGLQAEGPRHACDRPVTLEALCARRKVMRVAARAATYRVRPGIAAGK